MSDAIREAIESRISELRGELDHLKATLDTYKNKNSATGSPRLSGKELGDLVTEWFKGMNRPDAVFNNNEAANGIGMQSRYAARGFRSLLSILVFKDTSTSKS
jgi:hypothetical protein